MNKLQNVLSKSHKRKYINSGYFGVLYKLPPDKLCSVTTYVEILTCISEVIKI